MEVVKQSAIMEPSAIGTGTMFSSFANIESMGKVEEQRIANAFLDEDKTPLNPPVYAQEVEQLHRPDTTQTWYTCKNTAIPVDQVAIVSPSVGEKLKLEKQVIPIQLPAAGEVLVKVAWTGICGSDVLFSIGPQEGYRGENHIAGHEGIGQIVQSQDPSLLGTPVAMRYLASYCRSCKHCLYKLPECCEQQTNFPKHYQGTFQQYLTAPLKSLMPLPRWVFEDESRQVIDEKQLRYPANYVGALCSGAAALRALKNLDPRPGSVIVISGIGGGIGHLAGQLARNVFNVKVIGVDWAPKKESLYLSGSSASDVFDVFVPASENESQRESFQRDIIAACVELRGPNISPQKADGLIVTASSAAAYEGLSDYVCSGGSIICVGVPKTKVTINIPLTDLVDRSIRVQGGLMGGWEESYEVMEYIRRGQIKPITTEISLDRVPEFMQGFAGYTNVGKIVVRVDDSKF